MNTNDNQRLESFIPVYDVIPEKWEDARPALLEFMKKMSTAINTRDIGYFLDEECVSGKQYLPGINDAANGGTSQQFRTILRKVIVFPVLNIGLNSMPHGILIDGNFSLIQLYGSATDAITFTGEPIPNSAVTMTYDAVNINIIVSTAFTRANATIEYIQEL